MWNQPTLSSIVRVCKYINRLYVVYCIHYHNFIPKLSLNIDQSQVFSAIKNGIIDKPFAVNITFIVYIICFININTKYSLDKRCLDRKKHALVGMEISFHATTRSEITALWKIASFDKAIISLKYMIQLQKGLIRRTCSLDAIAKSKSST